MTKTGKTNKRATKKLVEIFNTGDLSEVDVLFSSAYIDHQRPSWMDVTGPEEFKQIVLGARKSLPHLHVTIEEMLAERDTVALRLHWQSPHPAGKTIDRETIDMLRYVNGQVVEHWGAEAWTTETTPTDMTS